MREITRVIPIQLIMLHKLPIEAAKLIHIGIGDRLAGMVMAASFDAVD